MNKILSIVIPTYNMEKYLHRCLNSLLIEKRDLLEVLIINDGSRDSSLAIAKEYEGKYPETFQVIDKENGNYGSCVNRGIDEATGKYFRILDADDYFDIESLAILIDKILAFEEEPDLIITNHQEDYAEGYSAQYLNQVYEYDRIYKIDDVDFGCQLYTAVMHRMTYKLDVVRKSGLRHLEGISYTDTEYCFYPLRAVNSLVFFDILLYRYQIGREGQTVSIASYQRNIHDLYRIIDRILNSFTIGEKEASYYHNIITEFKLPLFIYYRTLLTSKFDNNEDLRTLDNRIKALDINLYDSLRGFKKSRIIPFVALWRMGFKPNNNFFLFLYESISKIQNVTKELRRCFRVL